MDNKLRNLTVKLLKRHYISALLFCIACSLPVNVRAQQAATAAAHTMQPGETVMSLVRRYGTTLADLRRLNPGLDPDKVQVGQVVRVPKAGAAKSAQQPRRQGSYKEYKVKKKDTAYSLAKANGITVDELMAANPELKAGDGGLKKGAVIRIPVKGASPKPAAVGLSTVRVAVILPFLGNGVENVRSVEFYRGMLMGLDKLKQAGTNIVLSAFNEPEPNASVAGLMGQVMAGQPDLIVGPLYPTHFADVTAVSARKTKVAIPFSSKVPQVDYRPEVFVVNTPAAYEQSLAVELFLKNFKKTTGVLMLHGADGSKRTFCSALQNRLAGAGYDVLRMPASSEPGLLSAVLTGKKHDMYVLVADDASENTLDLMLAKVESLKQAMPGKQFAILGYDAWLPFAEGKYRMRMHAADVYVLTSSYFYPYTTASKAFRADYERWFKTGFVECTPRMAPLGYDFSRAFIGGMATYGYDFATQSPQAGTVAAEPKLQTDARFVSVGRNGGYVSRSMWLVHFKPDMSIVKISAQ